MTKHDFALYKINVLILQNFIVGAEILMALKCKRHGARARTQKQCIEKGNVIQRDTVVACTHFTIRLVIFLSEHS